MKRKKLLGQPGTYYSRIKLLEFIRHSRITSSLNLLFEMFNQMDDLYIAKDIGKYNTSKLFVIVNNFIEQIGDCMGTKPSSKRLPR